jgi:hypothetical protein
MKKLLQHILEQKEITKSPLIGMRGKHEDLFYTFSLDTAAEAKEVKNKLLTIKHEIDLVPICLGDIDDFNFLIQHLADHSLQEANSIIRSAFSLDLENWKRERALAVLEDLFAPRQYPSKVLSGLDFPSLIPPDGPIFVGLVPGKRSWVAPAFVDVGGTNDYPPSMVTCRILRNFEDRLNAHVYAIRKNQIGLVIDPPVTDEFLVREIRMEMFLYCTARGSHIHKDDGYILNVLGAKFWDMTWGI